MIELLRSIFQFGELKLVENLVVMTNVILKDEFYGKREGEEFEQVRFHSKTGRWFFDKVEMEKQITLEVLANDYWRPIGTDGWTYQVVNGELTLKCGEQTVRMILT